MLEHYKDIVNITNKFIINYTAQCFSPTGNRRSLPRSRQHIQISKSSNYVYSEDSTEAVFPHGALRGIRQDMDRRYLHRSPGLYWVFGMRIPLLGPFRTIHKIYHFGRIFNYHFGAEQNIWAWTQSR